MPETVRIEGDGHVTEFEVDDTIVFPSLIDIVLANAKLKAVDALNVNMFENANPATHNYGVSIRGDYIGYIDGNGAEQSAGNTLRFVNATNITPISLYTIWTPTALYLENVFITSHWAPHSCIHIDFTGSAGSTIKWRNVNVGARDIGNSEYGVKLCQVYDSHIVESTFDGDAKALLAEACSCVKFDFSYFNNCATLYGCRSCDVTANYWDNSVDEHTLIFLYSRYCSAHDINFNKIGSNAYTGKSGIYVTDSGNPYYSIHNRFSNLIFTRNGFGGTNTFKYGVEESASGNNYNTMTGIDGDDCNTAAVRKLGANSKADADDIIGTIVTS
jgi:hypothetical protein